MTRLSVTELHCGFGEQTILKGVNLTLAQGEILALLGPSGCGKTTLLRAIAGLQPITSGQIVIKGSEVNGPDTFVTSDQRGVGLIFQDYALFPHLTVAQNVLFGVKLKGQQKADKLDEMLTLVKLQGLGERYPHELSGGQQQRVSIARSLAYEAEILLLDEPFSNIDPQVRHEMMLEIRQILKQRNISAVFVTHSKEEAFAFADTLALFKSGSIVQQGTPEQLYQTPKEAYVAEFLGPVNYLDINVLNETQLSSSLGVIDSNISLDKPVGEKGVLMLRPQNIEFISDKLGDAIVTQRRFLGSMCHYQLQYQQHIFELHSMQLQLVIGQKGHLKVKEHGLIIF
ncbi:ABC transporter ATP-binding protein [Shewanella sp.]|uniref:ABC transporter ATP-binding protein n=1 Tax=Shewanella sp. TaxID=50422 RepID=UPI004054591F